MKKLDDTELKNNIRKSASKRAEMISTFGFMPYSVLKIARGSLSSRMFKYQSEVGTRSISYTKKVKDDTKRMKGLGVRGHQSPRYKGAGRGKGGLSVMPAELVDFFIKYYTAPGQVYLDPFMGQGIQMQVARLRGLHYWGYDLSEEFFNYIEAVKKRIDDGKTTLNIFCGDSRTPDEIPDGVGDFSFNSPPYWDIEYYGDELEQLGTGKTYEEFLDGMEAVARAWLPKFKDGAWHVVNINDFRKGGRFYPYHIDLCYRYQKAGWTLHDLWIIDGLVGGLSKSFAVSFNDKKRAPKTHEYALVFRA